MGHEGDKKAFVGHDHGKKVEGTDGNEPTTEKQWRDMPKGSRPPKDAIPENKKEEVEPETQKATGIAIASAGFASTSLGARARSVKMT